jgi:RimJ/RimL family protein N-acetyltransferase/acyl carrier protein
VIRPAPLSETQFFQKLDKFAPGGETSSDIRQQGHLDVLIRFERMSMAGLEGMHEYSRDARMYQYLERTRPPTTLDDTEQYLRSRIKEVGRKAMGRTRIGWFIKRIKDDKIIGSMGLLNIDYERQMTDWGFGLGAAYWGKGYSLEMLSLTQQYVFEELCMNRIYGCTRVGNQKVINLLKVLGARQEGVARQVYRDAEGNYFDGWNYSILAEDYFANNKSLVVDLKLGGVLNKEMIARIISMTLGRENIEANAEMDSIAEWDSLTHVTVIAALQEFFGVRFPPAQIVKATSVSAIYDILNDNEIASG